MIVFKILLFILLAILGILLLIMLLPVGAEFSYTDKKMKYSFKYAFLNILDSDGNSIFNKINNKSKNTTSQHKTEETNSADIQNNESTTSDSNEATSAPEVKEIHDNTSQEASKSNDHKTKKQKKSSNNKKAPGEIFEFFMNIWRSAKRPLKKVFKGFHFYDIFIDFEIADEDAAKCAIRYGEVCMIVYNWYAGFSRIFTTKYKKLKVDCNFNEDKSRFDLSFKVRFLPITAVLAGIWFLITYLFRVYLPSRKKSKTKKSAKNQAPQPQG